MHEMGGDGGDVAEAEHVLVALAVVAGVGERGAADADVLEMIYVGAVAGDEGVLRAELPVEPCGAEPETLRRGDVGDGVDGVAGAVEGDGVDDGEVVDAAMLEGEGEVAACLADGAGELEAVTLLADGGFAGGEGIAGVHPGAAVGGEEGAVVGVLAGLGVDLDAAAVEGRLAVLGGEVVGVDLDVGDGALGRESAAALEAVDGDGGVGGIAAGCGGELLELAEEVVGVVGEGLQAVAGDGLVGPLARCWRLARRRRSRRLGFRRPRVAGRDRARGMRGGEREIAFGEALGGRREMMRAGVDTAKDEGAVGAAGLVLGSVEGERGAGNEGAACCRGRCR